MLRNGPILIYIHTIEEDHIQPIKHRLLSRTLIHQLKKAFSNISVQHNAIQIRSLRNSLLKKFLCLVNWLKVWQSLLHLGHFP